MSGEIIASDTLILSPDNGIFLTCQIVTNCSAGFIRTNVTVLQMD